MHEAASIYVFERLREIGLNCCRPEGAFYLFPDFRPFADALGRAGVATCSQLCDRMLSEAGVALLPGKDFGAAPDALAVRVASVDYDGAAAIAAAKGLETIDAAFVEQHCPDLKAGCDRIAEFLGALGS
jgi:aspartate/methionine/tyrosine aminotransferase